MKIIVDLPDGLVHTIKQRALSECIPLNDLVAELLDQALFAHCEDNEHYPANKASSTYQLDALGYPVVYGCANAPSQKASLRETLDIEQKAQSSDHN
jgi:hypothetical protein